MSKDKPNQPDRQDRQSPSRHQPTHQRPRPVENPPDKHAPHRKD